MEKSKRTRMIYLNNGLKPIVRSLIDFSMRIGKPLNSILSNYKVERFLWVTKAIYVVEQGA